jgi:hypothetical protein
MAATFVVEDGTSKTDSNSYLSVADADQYHENHSGSTTWSGATQANKEKALRLATQYLDVVYGDRWKGTRTDYEQALDWPRWDVMPHDEDTWWDSDAMPQPLLDACAELALISMGETLLPDQSNPGTVKSTAVRVGELSERIDYMGGNSPFKEFSMVEALVSELIEGSGTIERS